MKSSFVFLLCHLVLSLAGQEVIEGRWHVECGASTYTSFRDFSILNLRYISPAFRVKSDERDWTEEEEKHPKEYKKGRLMLELLYAPPLQFLGMGANLQYRLLKYKRLSLEGYGGLKFLFVTKPDYVINPRVSAKNKDIWYFNFGLIARLDLGNMAPFADLGTDGIMSIGTEVDFYALYKKVKRARGAPYLKQG